MQTKTLDCKHGRFTFFADDTFVGRSLDLYGDYSEDEISVFKMVLRPDDIAIEVGANIGSLTIPMARLCKTVYAFEPQPENYGVLSENILQNGIANVVTSRCAVGASSGDISVPTLAEMRHFNFGNVVLGVNKVAGVAPMVTLDDSFPASEKIRFIKLDCEGMELEVLKGAEKLIARDRPILYVENDREEKSAALTGWLIDHGYRCYWHRPPLFYAGNFRQNKTNVFGNIISLNMICLAEDREGNSVKGLEEVDDHRVDAGMYIRERKRAMRRVDKNPDDLEARFIAAHYANLDGCPTSARTLLWENLNRDPGHIGSLAIQGLLDLQDGNFEKGWPAYELRYHQHRPEGFGFRPHPEPHWDGEPTDETVLIWSEQGFGDSIMFVRFMDEVLKRAPNAILEVQPQLFELFETSAIMREGRLFRVGRALKPYTKHCSLPSLPATLKLYKEADVARGQYLFADQKMVDSWLKRDTPRIGICCKGGVASERAYSRDIPSELMEPLAKEFGPFMTLEHIGQWESYADTAAAISSLDLVITVDTSVAHLSGALGIPTWLMLSSDPDWRWQRRREDSPWYPTMKIFRQDTFMDWLPVVNRVGNHLEARRIERAA